jgi:stage II sporulation protein D
VTSVLAGPSVLSGCGRSKKETGSKRPDEPEGPASENPPTAEAESQRPALPVTEPVVRVRVASRLTASKVLRIGSAGGWIELTGSPNGRALVGEHERSGPGRSRPAPSVVHAPVEIRVGARGWSVLDGQGFRPAVEGFAPLEIRPLLDGPQWGLTIGDRVYPGWIRLEPRGSLSAEAVDVVNHVRLEDYLPGVLVRELFSQWHPETHAAQAVAARSFACAERAFFADRRHFDLTDDTASQMYIGDASQERAIEAVRATRGLVLAFADRLVPGYYSSCCGGLAADARDAIGEHPYNDVPPLAGRSGEDGCTDAPLYEWTIERSASDLRRRLAAFGERVDDQRLAAIGAVRAIRVASRNPHGRPRSYDLEQEDGALIPLDATTIRRGADFSAGPLPTPATPLWSSMFTAERSGDIIRFDGRGHGHGAGLCQYGAQALARQGRDADAILRWYYPQVELIRAYS